MYHEHFNSLDSTQIYLKNNLQKLLQYGDKDLLVSCSHQTHGIGRKGNSWESFPNSLAMSFTLAPQKQVPTLTPLEIAVILITTIKKKFGRELFVKWPNDLLTPDGKKCGGIICQFIDSSTIIAGVGINLGKFEVPERSFRHGLSIVAPDQQFTSSQLEMLAKNIYSEIINQRIDRAEFVRDQFMHYCFHKNRRVSILDNDVEQNGVFTGIGDIGEAIIEIDSIPKKFVSGVLTVL